MSDPKQTIDEVSSEAKKQLDKQLVTADIVADSEGVYDVRFSLKSQSESYVPRYVSFSYDKDTGYYIDIDDVTWEFDKDEATFRAEAAKYTAAIKDGKAKINKKKLFGIITLRKELTIVDN